MQKLQYAEISELFLDPQNPRLGRENTKRDLNQESILDLMKDWSLEELAVSFLESGFWPQEALIVIKEKTGKHENKVVIEGNRRLAALKVLERAYAGTVDQKKWQEIARTKPRPSDLFDKIPYLEVESRSDVEAFLGFRHVTGIKEWRPAEKAEFIARLVDQGGTYEEVMRKIGSKTPTVRQHYLAFKVLQQMEDNEDIALEEVEKRFSVLYLSLKSAGIQEYLGVNPLAAPKEARRPVKKERQENLGRFAKWVFGDDKHEPIITDSRQIDKFSRALQDPDAVAYLERNENPKLEIAFRMSGGDETEVVRHLALGADNVELALSRVHAYKKSKDIQKQVDRIGRDIWQLLEIFPAIKQQVMAGE